MVRSFFMPSFYSIFRLESTDEKTPPDEKYFETINNYLLIEILIVFYFD